MGPPDFEVVLDHPHVTKQFEALDGVLKESLRRQAVGLRKRPMSGTLIATSRIPKKTLMSWQERVGDLSKVRKIDLPRGWRALYTILTMEDARLVLFLEIVSHKEYDRLLGY